MHLANNQALYDYLRWLALELETRGAHKLGVVAASASKQASSMSAEFLGESRIALCRILNQENGLLNASERADLEHLLRQLTSAINRWPQRDSRET